MKYALHLLACRFVTLVGVIFFGHSTFLAVAEELPKSVVLFDTAELNFKPDEAVYFVNFGGNSPPVRLRGIIVGAPGNDGNSFHGSKWASGVRVDVPENSPTIAYSVLYKGGIRDLQYHAPKIEDVGDTMQFGGSPDILRRALLQRKEILRSWELQIKAQDESLERLREDASIIGNLGRIVELGDDLERTEAHVQNLEHDIDHLKEFLKMSREVAPPKNYASREAQLTQQLADFAEAAKRAEAGEFQRKSKAQGTLERKLAIIEQTRLENYDELQRTLSRLKSERESLQGGSQANSEEPVHE